MMVRMVALMQYNHSLAHPLTFGKYLQATQIFDKYLETNCIK